MTHRILEIGPGKQPMHHLEGGFHLKDGQEYIGLEIDREAFNARIWEQLRDNKQVHTVIGNVRHIPAQNGSFDEVVMLGSTSDDGLDLKEVDRVLRSGGIIKIGANRDARKWLEETSCKQLENMGYRKTEETEHTYENGVQPDFIMVPTPEDPFATHKSTPNPKAGQPAQDPYLVITYQKP